MQLDEIYKHIMEFDHEEAIGYEYFKTTFFSYLVQNYEDTIELASGSNKLNERMTAIENYMRQNYQTATLTGTANHFYISPAYLSTALHAACSRSMPNAALAGLVEGSLTISRLQTG